MQGRGASSCPSSGHAGRGIEVFKNIGIERDGAATENGVRDDPTQIFWGERSECQTLNVLALTGVGKSSAPGTLTSLPRRAQMPRTRDCVTRRVLIAATAISGFATVTPGSALSQNAFSKTEVTIRPGGQLVNLISIFSVDNLN